MHEVFISYSRRDRSYVQDVVAALRTSRIPVWIDESGIPVSVPWSEEITHAIRASKLVVIFDSPEWQGSAHCAAELDEARAWGTPTFRLEVGGRPPDGAALSILAEVDRLGPEAEARTELLVRSQDWRDQGRPRSGLVGGRALRRYRRVSLDLDPAVVNVADEFVRRSRHRQVRRRALIAVSATTVFASVAVGLGIGGRTAKLMGDYTMTAADATVSGLVMGVSKVDPFTAMELAIGATEVSSEGYLARRNLVTALSARTPVTVASGRSPTTRPKAGDTLDGGDSTSGYRAQSEVGSTAVRVIRDGTLRREFRTPYGVRAIALSPDSRILAAAMATEVWEYSVATGAVVQVLRGAPPDIDTVTWSEDGSTLRAVVSDGRTLEWTTGPGRAVIDDPDRWFMGVARLPGTGRVALLSRDGRVDLVNPATARVDKTWDVGPGPATRIAGGRDGALAILQSTDSGTTLTVIDGLGAEPREVAIPGCRASDVTFDTESNGIMLACGEGIGLWDRGSTFRVQPLPVDLPAQSIADAGDRIAVGSEYGHMFMVDAEGRGGWVGKSVNCGLSTRWLAGNVDGAVFQAGPGAGRGPCSYRYSWDGASVVTARVSVNEDVSGSEAVATSPDGTMVAFGYTDGTIAVWQADGGINPVDRITGASGSIRGLAFDDDSQSLVVATRAGQALVIDPPLAHLSGPQLRALAQARVDDAVEMGIHTLKLEATAPPG